MLLQMRNFARSWVAYLLLFVLVIAFAIWGVNDVFNGAGSQNVAKVGQYEITPAQLSRELQLTLRAQRAQGQNVTQQEAIDAGLHTRLLEGMIGRFSLYSFADKLGVSASDRQVGDRIRTIPNAMNQITGQFDRTAYEAFLNELGYTQPEFERDVRGDMTNQMLIEALVAGVRPPSSFGALALAYETEVRTVSILEAPESIVGTIAPPTDEQLQAFYQENSEALRVPEYRTLTFVVARPEDFTARVTVAEQDIEAAVEARRAALQPPERRTFVRLAAQNEAQANDAAQRLTRGETATAIATALGVQMTRSENATREEVPDQAVSDAVFSMAAGAPARVVRGQLSPFVVVRVESITAPPPVNMGEVRAQLRQQLALERADELLNEAIGAFEDARAGGVATADAARQHGLTVITVEATDAQGRDQAGQPIPALAGLEEPLRAAFETSEGEATDFLPSDNANVVVSVDRVIPESVRPLADVANELRQAWVTRERASRLREIGQEVAADIRGDTNLTQLARARGLRLVVSSQPVNRQAASQIPARGLAQQIFQARVGESVSDVRVDGGAVLIARVEAVERVDPSEAPQLVEASRGQSTRAVTESFAGALQAEVIERMNPTRNERLLERSFRPANQDAEAQ